MTGAAITIAVDDSALKAKFDRLVAQGNNLRVVMGDIGEYLVESTRHRFSTQVDPDGEAWQPLSPEYARRKNQGKVKVGGTPIRDRSSDDLLLLTGNLEDQIAAQSGDTEVIVGSPARYAATHQFGRENIPARAFLGLSVDDLREVSAIIEDHLSV